MSCHQPANRSSALRDGTSTADAQRAYPITIVSTGYLLKDSVSDLDELIDALTPREREVLALMAQGQSNAGIAKTLWITHGAVEKHIKHIFAKLRIPATSDTHRRALAAITFLENR